MQRTAILSNQKLVSELFFRLLPVQTGLVAMASVNSIIDGVVAGRFIGPEAVGVIGLYYTVLRILEAVGALLLAGSAILCGKNLGAGKIEETRGVLSMSMLIAGVFGAVLTLLSFLSPGMVSEILGADEHLKSSLSAYVVGYAVGIVPQLLGQQFGLCLQLERQEKRGEIGIVLMMCSNAILDIILVVMMDLGLFGLALATSISNWLYFFTVSSYYLKKHTQLKPSFRLIAWNKCSALIRVGAPNAILVVSLAARCMVVNRIVMRYCNADSLSALSAYYMCSGLILSFAIGAGNVMRILSSVFLGEENREGLIDLVKLAFGKVFIIVLIQAVSVSLLSPLLSGLFFSNHGSEVYRQARALFFIMGTTMPPSFFCFNYSSYFQAAGHIKFVHLLSVIDGFFSMVISAALLAPILGSMGVWLAIPIGLVITCMTIFLYVLIKNRHFPKNVSEWFLLDAAFGTKPHLILTITEKSQIRMIGETVQRFCSEHGLSHRTGMHAGLCMEEMTLNIVDHGFQADRKKHTIEERVVIRDDGVSLRIKDDCIPFNPREWYEMTDFKDPVSNIGIPMVYKLADDLNYQNLLGMNVLTIHFNPARAPG